MRVIRACREMGIATVAVYSDADRSALHVRQADEAYLLGPAPSRESYLRIDRVLAVAQEGRGRRHPPRLRLPRRERRLRPRLRGSGNHLHRPPRRDHRAHGREDLGPAGRGGGGGTRGAGDPRARDRSRRHPRRGLPHRLPADAQGRGGGRGQGPAPRGPGRRPRGRPGPGPERGPERLRRRQRLPREGHRPPPAHRDPGPGRQPRQRGPPLRARVLHPAPSPEGHRGEPVALPHRRPARAHGRARHRPREARGLRERGDHRVPGRPGPQALLPRDEHPPAGGASRSPSWSPARTS